MWLESPAPMWVAVLFLGSTLKAVASSDEGVCPQPPPVEFANAEPHKRVYEPGEHVIYTCKPGYMQRAGQRQMICPKSGKWNYVTMKCGPKSCAYPGPLEHGFINLTAMTYLSWIEFSCNEGFDLNGSDASQCTETGKWSHELPVCERVTCNEPDIPEFGKITFYKPKPGNISTFEDVVRYECQPKYALFGNETAICGANGNWSEIPECIDVKCPRPTEIENGFMTFATIRMYDYLEKVQYGCNPTYTLDGPRISRCEMTGLWSTKPTCKAACKMPDKKGIVLYSGQKVNLQDMKQSLLPHTEILTFYCKDKENDCAYTVPTQCINGAITIPSCFKEPAWHSFFGTYTHPADMKPCSGSV